MDKQTKKIIGLFSRYIIILAIGISNLYILYQFLTPATIKALTVILSIFTNPVVTNNIIYLEKVALEIVPACVAGSGFYLLLILILSTAEIKPKRRAKTIITAFAIFFILNITRILILIPLTGSPAFETIHWIFWHLISIVFVVAVWFNVVKIYKIKKIPVYSDIKYMISLIKSPKNSKRKKKNN